ncbi:MAG TPA: PH domain-containing protein [Tepidiformaceae bacterium]
MHPRTRPSAAIGTAVVRPPRALGVIIGGAFAAWALLFALLSANAALGAEPGFKTFLAWLAAAVLGMVALVFANWTFALITLAYEITDEALTIRWGFRRVIVPIAGIQRMIPGRTLDEAQIDGLNWWGCHIGTADVKRIGYTLFYSTHSSPEELLYVVTTDESYALTVLDQASFAEEVQGRAQIGAPVHPHPQRSAATGLAAIPFWRDGVATTATAIAVLACVVLSGYVFASYPGLPNVIQLSFPHPGGIVRVGDKSELLEIVYLAVGILTFNTVLGILIHARERAAGLWLLASSGMLQAVLFAAAIAAFRQA